MSLFCRRGLPSAHDLESRLKTLKAIDDIMLAGCERDRERLHRTELALVALRRRLRAADATLPDEYDGAAWQPIEAAA